MIEHTAPNTLDQARELVQGNRPREAATLLSRYLQEHPRDEEAWHLLSYALSDPQKQAYALQRVLKINPGNRAARAQLARLLRPTPPHPDGAEARPLPGSTAEGQLAVALDRAGEISAPPRGFPGAPAAERGGRSVPDGSLAGETRDRPAPVALPSAELPAFRGAGTLPRVARYFVVKGAILLLTVAVGLFLAVVLINYGGFIDKIFEANINEALGGIAWSMRTGPPEDIAPAMEQARIALTEAYGLNDPFLLRCFRWWARGITLNWGDAERFITFGTREHSVLAVILERLPNSLLLIGAGNLVIFFASLFLALFLSKRYGSLVDRLVIGLSPLSAAPTWVHGILLTVIFAAELAILPFSGMYDEVPPAQPIGYVWVIAKHMILPVAAIFLATFFQSVYAWRTFFVLHSREDYVEMAEAMGLPVRIIERRYILRPALPFIITSFALVLLTSWQGLLVLETFFHWPGIGALFIEAVQRIDRPVLVGLIVIFAYLLALTVLLLDLVYAFVDPRVKILAGNEKARPRRQKRMGWRRRARPLELRRWSASRPKSRPEKAGASSQPVLPLGPAAKSPPARWQDRIASPFGFVKGLGRLARGLRPGLAQLMRYPSALLGLVLILFLISMAVYAMVTIPLDEAVRLSRSAREDWYLVPNYAQPAWVNLFRKHDLPPSIIIDSTDASVSRTVEVVSDNMTRVLLSYPFDYAYDSPPQDLLVFIRTNTREKRPYVSLRWLTPDGRTIEITNFAMLGSDQTYYLSGDTRFARRARGQEPLDALFLPPEADGAGPLHGRYELQVDARVFEEDYRFDARLVVKGLVHGMAGTDHMGRDLMVPLLWGTPVALAFGFVGAVGTALFTLVIAATGTWFGGWVDELIQRLTEVNMILPTLPIAIMVYVAYSKSVWVILGVMVVFSIFGSAIKNYRAIFLQVKESPFIEAAEVYGASDRRIVFRYLVPRILPILVPHLVTLIPAYVFLEATLAYLGIRDPILPTWGKVIYEALRNGAFNGYYYWVLEPLALLLATGLAFALLGFALDRILNPRLRTL